MSEDKTPDIRLKTYGPHRPKSPTGREDLAPRDDPSMERRYLKHYRFPKLKRISHVANTKDKLLSSSSVNSSPSVLRKVVSNIKNFTEGLTEEEREDVKKKLQDKYKAQRASQRMKFLLRKQD